MIAYLKGEIKEKTDKSILLVCSGVGYQVFVSESILSSNHPGQTIELYTHTHFSTRDETMVIYGFVDLAELRFFEQLISVSGVGRKSALGALSVATFSDLQKTIAQGDPALLQKVGGIGKKTAERIVVELKDKLLDSIHIAQSDSDLHSGNEIIQALESLGYSMQDIREVVRGLPQDLQTTEEKIKMALQRLAK